MGRKKEPAWSMEGQLWGRTGSSFSLPSSLGSKTKCASPKKRYIASVSLWNYILTPYREVHGGGQINAVVGSLFLTNTSHAITCNKAAM